jgi:cellulose synthase/poly-beta-1,6-N-acetylglucosamine synthase-like glycosyltransferase
LILFRVEYKPANQQDWPKISILVPTRNEASNLEVFFEHLLMIDYPKEKVEIIIGEDRSTDETPAMLSKYAQLDSRITVINITGDLPGLVGKANVIGQLIPYSSSDYYFITDADVRVPPGWVKALLLEDSAEAGVIGGTTVVADTGFWSNLQRLDWFSAQGSLYVAGKIFRAVAVSGTNMMITKNCCLEIGGYQNIPYPLTEDIGTLTAAKKAGFSGKNVLHQQATATTKAQPDWRSLISQRSRWVYGVLRLPVVIVLLLLLRALFLPFTLSLALWWPFTAILVYLIKTMINTMLIRKVSTQIGQSVSLKYILLFELYWFLMAATGLLTHLFSKRIVWKGRSYH